MRSSTFTSRKATSADLPFLLELRKESMGPHLAASGVTQSDDAHMQRVLAHFESAEVLLVGEQPVGLLKVVRTSTFWELVQIQLSAQYRGRGNGTFLLQRLASEADGANAELRLSVLKANPARKVYERLGFSVFTEDAHAYEMRRAPNPSMQPTALGRG